MTLKDFTENTTVKILSFVIVGFMAGIAVYEGILRIAKLDTVRQGTYILKEDIPKNYIEKKEVNRISQELLTKVQEKEKTLSNCNNKNIEIQNEYNMLEEKYNKIVTENENVTVSNKTLAKQNTELLKENQELKKIIPGYSTIKSIASDKLSCELIKLFHQYEGEMLGIDNLKQIRLDLRNYPNSLIKLKLQEMNRLGLLANTNTADTKSKDSKYKIKPGEQLNLFFQLINE